jgi:hypothetical protein
MSGYAVPSADDLKCAALSDDFGTVIHLATSGLAIVQSLSSAGQAARELRDQAEVLKGTQDEAGLAILKAHLAAENLLSQCAEAAHLVIKYLVEREARRDAAKFN